MALEMMEQMDYDFENFERGRMLQVSIASEQNYWIRQPRIL